MERTRQRRLQVAQHRVDPDELGQFARLTLPHHERRVQAARAGDRGEAPQPVADHPRSRHQRRLRPLAHRLQREAAHRRELDLLRMPLVIDRDRRHERHLVLRTPTRLAAAALSAKVGIVKLHRAVESVLVLSLGHRVHDLLVHQPRRRVAHAHLPLERQRRQPCLGLAEQVDRQEPRLQWQLGAGEQAARGQRGLVAAAVALEQLARPVAHHVVRRTAAARALEALRPTRLLDGLGALLFRAEAGHELGSDIPCWNWIRFIGMCSLLRFVCLPRYA